MSEKNTCNINIKNYKIGSVNSLQAEQEHALDRSSPESRNYDPERVPARLVKNSLTLFYNF